MKKILSLLLVLCVCFSVFANGSTEQKQETAKTEIKIWHTYGAGPGLDAVQKIVDMYNEKNTKNIHAILTYVANQKSGNTQTMANLMAAIAAGNPPDVALIDNFQIASWASQDSLCELDGYMAKSGLTLDNFYDWAAEGSEYKGKTYSIPYNGDSRALVYNKEMFRKAGLDPENPPTTIAEVEEANAKLTIKDGSTYKQVGFIPWLFAGLPIYTWGWSFGGDFYDAKNNVLTIATPENIAAIQWEVDYAKKSGGKDFVNYASGLGTGAEDPFVTGQVAMCVRGNFNLADFKRYAPDLDYGVTPIPSLKKGENITWCGGWGWTIPKGTKNAEAAFDFINFAASEECNEVMAQISGSLSPYKGVSEKVFAGDPKYTVFIDMLKVARVRPSVPVGQQLWSEFNTLLEAALIGEGDPAQMMKALDEKMNTELKKYK